MGKGIGKPVWMMMQLLIVLILVGIGLKWCSSNPEVGEGIKEAFKFIQFVDEKDTEGINESGRKLEINLACNSVDLAFEIEEACLDEVGIRITVFSSGRETIEGFDVVFDSTKIFVDERLESFYATELFVNGTAENIEMIPYIRGDIECPNRKEIADVEDC